MTEGSKLGFIRKNDIRFLFLSLENDTPKIFLSLENDTPKIFIFLNLCYDKTALRRRKNAQKKSLFRFA